MSIKALEAKKIGELAAALCAKGYRVVAPIQDGDKARLKVWAPGAVIRTDAMPVNSGKEFVLPPCEVIGRYALDGDDFTWQDVAPDATKTVLLGCGRAMRRRWEFWTRSSIGITGTSSTTPGGAR